MSKHRELKREREREKEREREMSSSGRHPTAIAQRKTEKTQAPPKVGAYGKLNLTRQKPMRKPTKTKTSPKNYQQPL